MKLEHRHDVTLEEVIFLFMSDSSWTNAKLFIKVT